MRKNMMCAVMIIVTFLTGCFRLPYQEEGEELGRELSYADEELLAAIGTSISSLERAREAIELGAEINLYDESQIEIYDQPRSKDRTLLLTPIRVAFHGGALTIVKELVKSGADVNIEETDGKTPLMFLANRGDDLEWIKLMVNAGADVTHRNEEGLTALDYAAASSLHRGTDVLEYLIEQGARADGNTVKMAMETGYPDYRKVEYLIKECEKNGEKWGIYADYMLPYLAALGTGDGLEKRLQQELQPDLDETDQAGDSLLMVAASMGNLDTMQYLINSGANIQFINSDDETALTKAASYGRYEAVKLLMDSGYEFLPYNEKYEYENEMDKAAGNGDSEMMKLLFSYGFQLKDTTLHYALDGACRSGNIEAIDLLVDEAQKQGLKADFVRGNGLLYATWDSDLKVVRHLLEKYEVNINQHDGACLNSAVENNDIEMVKCLLDHGAEINLKKQETDTPLSLAVDYGGIEMVELLVEAGADIEQPAWNGDTAVLYSAATSSRILKYLVEKGADINRKFPDGSTCLYYAVISGKRENVDYLLSIGADTTPIVKDGKTSYQIAKERGDKEIMQIFKKYGKDR